MNEPLVAEHPTPPVNRHWALAVILLLPVLAIVCIDIVLIYFQITYAPSSTVASDVSHSVLTNTAWVLDKISVGGGTVLFVVTLELLFFVQSLRQFLLCAVALTVHLATVYFVDPAVLTPPHSCEGAGPLLVGQSKGEKKPGHCVRVLYIVKQSEPVYQRQTQLAGSDDPIEHRLQAHCYEL